MSCTLCDLPTPDPPVVDDEVGGTFCCRGCLEVARVLDDAESADAAAVREELRDSDAGEIPANAETAFLAVQGMHCATCEVFVESRARERAGVYAVEASYPTGAVKLTYDPTRLDEADLPSTIDGLGYRARGFDEQAHDDFETGSTARLLVGGFFGMMTMLWYVLFLYPSYLGLPGEFLLFDLHSTAGWYLLANVWLFATVVLVYTGYPLLRGAYVSLRAGYPNMDLLVALAASTAYVYSTVGAVLGRTEVYFDITVVIVLVVSLGTRYERLLLRRATDRLAAMTTTRIDEARHRIDGRIRTIDVSDLQNGDEVVVRTGERVPADGRVVEGTAAVDESLVTGESLPIRKVPGDTVIGGAAVTDGGLVVAVDGADSTLDRLARTLWEVRSTRPGVQRLADRLATVFVPLVVGLALLASGWQFLSGASATTALLTGLAVLVVSCPCALGLATPLAVASGLRSALDAGIVITDGTVFERATEAEIVAFDKTGTLTTGRMSLRQCVATDEGPDDQSGDRSDDQSGDRSGTRSGSRYSDRPVADGGATVIGDDAAREALTRAAAVEQFADHPVARAVVNAAGTVPERVVEGFETHPGRGVSAAVDGERVVVGRGDLVAERGWTVPDDLGTMFDRAREAGQIAAYVAWGGAARAVLVAGDEPRAEWETVVDALADRRIVVITGDGEAAAARYREHPAIDEVFAGVPPEAKAEVVERLRAEGTTVMVGDGSNDAPALAAADLGIALESGTALAADAADAVLTTGDLRTLPAVFELTATTRRRIRGNLGWAFVYNAIAIPVAVAGLLNPLVAAVAMAASSLLVVGNSARSYGIERVAGTERDASATDSGTAATSESRD